MTPPPTRRVNRGKGHSYYMDGDNVVGVTTVIRDGVPKPQFAESASKKTAGYAITHWDELAELDLGERYETLRRARWAAVTEAGVRGTNVHTLAHRLSLGEEVSVPDELVGHVDAYLRFEREWEPEELHVEAPVGNRRRRYMGTPDVIARLNDGQLWLLDWKTRDSGIWPDDALQLAAYRYAEFILLPDYTEAPMPKVDATGCVHIRADGYDLIPVETGEDVFRTFLHALQVSRFTTASKDEYVGESIQPPKARPAAA